MKKNVLIVTLPQGLNYGGILQAHALQSVIRDMEINAETTYSTGSSIHKLKRLIKNVLKFSSSRELVASKYTREFIVRHTKLISYSKAKKLTHAGKYDAYVVGSDQVWRHKYTEVPHNLLDFVKDSSTKISYAASFGKDDINDYGPRLVDRTKKLAQRFDAISVREYSGVVIASRQWELNALCHVDPTLLLDRDRYDTLIDTALSPTYKSKGKLFSYVLDPEETKQNIARMVTKKLKLEPFTVIDGDENNGRPMPAVEQWLRSFRDAEYIVADSFHGIVFSIIFNKPFIAIGNSERGLARFVSLLNIFDLEDRLVTSVHDVTEELIEKPIDWTLVNAKIKHEQKRSMNYLRKYLG